MRNKVRPARHKVHLNFFAITILSGHKIGGEESMKIVKHLKDAFRRFYCWVDYVFGPDRLTVQPRKIIANSVEKDMLNNLRKLYWFSQKTNIAVTGGKAVGKKSFIRTFEASRILPVGKFLRVDIRSFAEQYVGAKDTISLQSALDAYILDSIVSRAHQGELPGLNDRLIRGNEKIYRKPLVAIIMAVLMMVVFRAKNQLVALVNYLPETWNTQVISLVIDICCAITIIACFVSIIKSVVAFWPLRWLKIKMTLKTTPLEVSIDDNICQTEDWKHIIYVLKKMRWKIGHTVVFTDLDALDEEAFSKTITHLSSLNRITNEHVKAWKLWEMAVIRRPIRFIYVYRNDLVQLGVDTPLFDDIFYIIPTVTTDNVFYELKRAFEKEVSKGATFPIDKLFPIDSNYEVNVSKYIVDRRILNMIVKRSIQTCRDFALRIQPESPSENDIHGLFSFVLYGLFFPKDSGKFTDKTSIVFTKSSKREDIDPRYINLFEYLVSNRCPEAYRISDLCMRFVGLQPSLMEEYIRSYNSAYDKKDYQTALLFIEKAIRCQPDNELLIKKREKLLHLKSTKETSDEKSIDKIDKNQSKSLSE